MMTLAFLLTDVHSNNNLTKFGVILMDVFRVRFSIFWNKKYEKPDTEFKAALT